MPLLFRDVDVLFMDGKAHASGLIFDETSIMHPVEWVEVSAPHANVYDSRVGIAQLTYNPATRRLQADMVIRAEWFKEPKDVWHATPVLSIEPIRTTKLTKRTAMIHEFVAKSIEFSRMPEWRTVVWDGQHTRTMEHYAFQDIHKMDQVKKGLAG
jgi:hypothetical protein